MGSYIKYNDQYYILASSSLADDRVMVLKYGDSFAVFDRFGDVHPIGSGAQGIFFQGTRFLSKTELLIDSRKPVLLSSSLKEENEILTVDLTNPDIDTGKGTIIEKGHLHIHRTKFLWNDVAYENIQFSNFSMEPLTFHVSMLFDSDFTDIFEVRGMHRIAKGTILNGKAHGDEITLGYKGLDEHIRKTRIRFNRSPEAISTEKADFQICLLPQGEENIELSISFEIGDEKKKTLSYHEAHDQLVSFLQDTKQNKCEIYSSNDKFNGWISRSRSDMDTMVSDTQHGPYPYAGVPWYSCPFGRDGILTAMECLWMDPALAKGVLNFCAATQAKNHNDFEDAEPGKIFHEKRGGEMAELGEIPFKLYYGTIDATPLFVVLAGMYLERTNDLDFIRNIWPNIEAALEWIEKYGDLDGDGFVEYAKKSDKGLINQGWKDSHDSVMYEDGRMAEGAIALCEVQGYVYDAWIKASEIAMELGMADKSDECQIKAEELAERFARTFWDEEKQTFVLALDGNKKPCRVVSSNAGHCLFSGIVSKIHSEKLAKTLLHDSMFSGWGIRTLANNEARYNPMSYHNGSIWPHDNAIIAYGLAQYGHREEVNKILQGMFDVSLFVEHQRLPELFCGFKKRRNEGPTAYPVACSPQAWAIGSVYMLLQACLGLRIVAKDNAVYLFKPTLPEFIQELTIANLRVNDSTIVLQIRRTTSGEASVNILHREGDATVEVIHEYLCSQRLPEVLEKSLKIECQLA